MDLEHLSLDFETLELSNETVLDRFIALSCPKMDEEIRVVVIANRESVFDKIKSNPSIFTKIVINNKEFCDMYFIEILDHLFINFEEYQRIWLYLIQHYPAKLIENIYPYLNTSNIINVLDPLLKAALEDVLVEETNSLESRETVFISTVKSALINSNLLFRILRGTVKHKDYLVFFKHLVISYPDLIQLLLQPKFTFDVDLIFHHDFDTGIQLIDLLCQKISYPVLAMTIHKDKDQDQDKDQFIHSKTFDKASECILLLSDQILELVIKNISYYTHKQDKIKYNTYSVDNPLSFQYLSCLKLISSIISINTYRIEEIPASLWTEWITFFNYYPHHSQFHKLFYDLLLIASHYSIFFKIIVIECHLLSTLIENKSKCCYSDAFYFTELIARILNDKLQDIPEICLVNGWEDLLNHKV